MAVECSVLQSHSLRHDGACPGAISRKGSVVGLLGGGMEEFSVELLGEPGVIEEAQ